LLTDQLRCLVVVLSRRLLSWWHERNIKEQLLRPYLLFGATCLDHQLTTTI
jgi:hypothetical protein